MIFEGKIAKGDIPILIQKAREIYKSQDLENLMDLYFQNNELIEKSFKDRDERNLTINIQSNLALIEPLIEYYSKLDGEFMQLSIPAIEKGLIFFAVHRYIGQLKNIEEIIETFSDLAYYKSELVEGYSRYKISEYIDSNITQNDLSLQHIQKNLEFDNRLVTETTKYLEKFSIIKRVKDRGDYKLLKP